MSCCAPVKKQKTNDASDEAQGEGFELQNSKDYYGKKLSGTSDLKTDAHYGIFDGCGGGVPFTQARDAGGAAAGTGSCC